MGSMLIAREKGENIISYVDFSKFFRVIRCFPDLKETFGKEDIAFLLSSSSKSIECLISILFNKNSICIELIQPCTKTSKSTKIFKNPYIYSLG